MINYVIFEMQTDKDGKTALVPPEFICDETEAWSAFFYAVSFAIKSKVYCHTVMLCTTDGRVLDSRNYVHEVEG